MLVAVFATVLSFGQTKSGIEYQREMIIHEYTFQSTKLYSAYVFERNGCVQQDTTQWGVRTLISTCPNIQVAIGEDGNKGYFVLAYESDERKSHRDELFPEGPLLIETRKASKIEVEKPVAQKDEQVAGRPIRATLFQLNFDQLATIANEGIRRLSFNFHDDNTWTEEKKDLTDIYVEFDKKQMPNGFEDFEVIEELDELPSGPDDSKQSEDIEGVLPDPNAFIMVEKVPQPVNLDEVVELIGYPELAKESSIEGQVIVRILLDEKGNYMKHSVIKNPHPLLTKAVEKQVHKLKFTPAIQAGKPVKYWVTIPFKFKLEKPGKK